MSKYTTEVRFICESYAGLKNSEGQNDVSYIIAKSKDKVFNFDFPIYDESYRPVLETKILKHYYTREIGCETVGLWKHFLDMKMNEIMPYYNQLYKSATLKFNPLYDCDYSVTSNRNIGHDETTTNDSKESYTSNAIRTDNLTEKQNTNNTRTDNLTEGTNGSQTRTDNLTENTENSDTRTDNLIESTNSTETRTDNLAHHDTTVNSDNSRDKYSDTPQGALTNVENDTYLTNARIIDKNGNTTNDGTNTGTQKVDSNGSKKNTGTQKTDSNGSKTNTGTQKLDDSVTKTNTGTQKNNGDSSKTNTGTQKNDGSGSRTGTENGQKQFNSTDEYVEHVAGKRNSITYSKMLMEYRETFINIDLMIINELSGLFMNLW